MLNYFSGQGPEPEHKQLTDQEALTFKATVSSLRYIDKDNTGIPRAFSMSGTSELDGNRPESTLDIFDDGPDEESTIVTKNIADKFTEIARKIRYADNAPVTFRPKASRELEGHRLGDGLEDLSSFDLYKRLVELENED